MTGSNTRPSCLTARLAIAFLGCAFASSVLLGQNAIDVNSGVQFDFSLPGARSVSMAGAFVAIADDASAAFSNPAGLLNLSKPEVSVEGRSWDFTNTAGVSGHAFGSPTGIGVDTQSGIQDGEFEADASGLSFASFVYPREAWAIALFYHSLSQYNTDVESQGVFRGPGEDCGVVNGVLSGPTTCDRLFPFRGTLDLEIDSIGAAAAFEVGERVRVGASVSRFDFMLRSDSVRYQLRGRFPQLPCATEDCSASGEIFGAADFSPSQMAAIDSQSGDDTAWGGTIGLTAELSQSWILGLAYRYAPSFDYDTHGETLLGVAGDPVPPDSPIRIRGDNRGAPFNLPHVASLGLSYRPVASPNWTIAVEVDRIEYSRLSDDYTEVLDLRPPEVSAALAEGLDIDDAVVPRLGTEYVFLGRRPVALRGGVSWEPEHKLTMAVDDPETGRPVPRQAILFREGDDSVHVAAGVGIVFETFQVDLGADLSDVSDTYSLSTVVRW